MLYPNLEEKLIIPNISRFVFVSFASAAAAGVITTLNSQTPASLWFLFLTPI